MVEEEKRHNGITAKDKLKIEEYDLHYIEQIISQYDALPVKDIPVETQQIFKKIKEKRTKGELITIDRYMAENALLQFMPADRLRRASWSLRNRYKYAVGEDAYKVYVASVPPNPASATEAELRADLLHLLAEIQRIEIFRKFIEKSRYKIACISGFVSLIFLLIVLCFILIKTRIYPEWPFQFTPLMFVGAAGALGGSLSTIQKVLSAKIWTESIDQILEFQRSLMSWLFIPPVLGVLFAVSLFMLFSSELLTGSPFPKIATIMPHSILFEELGTPEKALAFLKHTSPVQASDFGKMIIWSFIAGFSQRFVPDALSRLAKESEPKNQKG